MASRSQRRSKAKARKLKIMAYCRSQWQADFANARKSEPRVKLVVTQVRISLKSGKVRPSKTVAVDTLERSTTVDSTTLCQSKMARALGKGVTFHHKPY